MMSRFKQPKQISLQYVNQHKKLAVAVFLATLSSSGYAQESEDDLFNDESPAIEELFIIGYRSSLMKSLASKKESYNITDAIYAEDIGKTSDQSIAEALQRVTGVSIERIDGEGTTVVVRGVGDNLNNVMLNGIPLTGSGDSQSVNFSEFSADILQSIEVQKTGPVSATVLGLIRNVDVGNT